MRTQVGRQRREILQLQRAGISTESAEALLQRMLNLSPWLKALEDVRRKATREGWCYRHVQAIIVAIDQYAEAATGNREYFLEQAALDRRLAERRRPLSVA